MLATAALTLLPLAVPTQEAWTTKLLSAPRQGAMVVALGGQILVAGGEDGSPNGLSDRVDLFTEATGTSTVASLSQARAFGSTATPPGRAMFAGGVAETSGMLSPSDVIDVYEQSTGLWSQLALSEPRFRMASAQAISLVAFAGGETDLASSLPVASATVDLFSNTLPIATTSLSRPRAQLSGALALTSGGFAFLFAGGRNGSEVYDDVDVITLSGTLGGSIGSLSQARYDLCAASTGSRTLFAGGTDANGVPTDVVDIFTNVGGASWTTATLSEPRTGMSSATLDGKAYFFGGLDVNGVPSTTVDVFDGLTGIWSTLAPLPTGDSSMNAAVSGPRVYLPNGSLGTDEVFVLQIAPSIGVPFCGPAQPNSSGLSATVEAIGNAVGIGQPYEVTLHAAAMPTATFSMFLAGLSPSTQQVGSGTLCLGSGLLRIRPSIAFVRGAHRYEVQVTDVDETGAANPILAGQTWYFQAWFRDLDPGATSNFTDSVAISFQ